jgi:hypothetical protein
MTENQNGFGPAWQQLAGACSPRGVPCAEAKHRVHFSDDHAPQAIGAYDLRLSAFCREQKVTPNIDRLAAEGALFPNSFCGNSSVAQPGCCNDRPARPRQRRPLPGRTGQARHVKFPTALRAGGLPDRADRQVAPRQHHHRDRLLCLLPGQGATSTPPFSCTTGAVRRAAMFGRHHRPSLEWLEHRDRSKPFLLMVHHKAPHRNGSRPSAMRAGWTM